MISEIITPARRKGRARRRHTGARHASTTVQAVQQKPHAGLSRKQLRRIVYDMIG